MYSFFQVSLHLRVMFFFFFQAEDGIRDVAVTGVQTCALPISDLLQAGGAEAISEGLADRCQLRLIQPDLIAPAGLASAPAGKGTSAVAAEFIQGRARTAPHIAWRSVARRSPASSHAASAPAILPCPGTPSRLREWC